VSRVLHISQQSLGGQCYVTAPALKRLSAPQVEVRRSPELVGKPVAVIQYNPFGDLQV